MTIHFPSGIGTFTSIKVTWWNWFLWNEIMRSCKRFKHV